MRECMFSWIISINPPGGAGELSVRHGMLPENSSVLCITYYYKFGNSHQVRALKCKDAASSIMYGTQFWATVRMLPEFESSANSSAILQFVSSASMHRKGGCTSSGLPTAQVRATKVTNPSQKSQAPTFCGKFTYLQTLDTTRGICFQDSWAAEM